MWDEVDKYHSRLHNLGGIVIESVKNNEYNGLSEHINEARELSEKIIELFSRMIAVATEMDINGERIF